MPLLRFDVDWNSLRPSCELFDSFYDWLKITLAMMISAALLIIIALSIIPAPWPAPWPVVVPAIVLVILGVPLGIGIRFLWSANTARAREAFNATGVRGFVARHGSSLGLAAVVAVLVLAVVSTKFCGH